MFALEIDFRDGISPPETILVRRSNAIIGSSELAHVVVEGAASSVCELRLIRGLGREFSCLPVRRPGQPAANPSFLEGTYAGEAELRLGSLSFHVTSLDIDLNLMPDEFPDRAAVRVLRRAASSGSPLFPAVAVLGAQPMFVSFPAAQPLLIGRSRKCGLRLDASDVSGEHARIGMESDSCWVEDLGSTNGTFIGEERVSGRRFLQPGELILLGAEFTLMPILSADDVARLNSESKKYPDTSALAVYPCIVTKCETVRPVRYSLKQHQRITVGRDPANDIWANYPHISRNHVELVWTGDDTVRAVDHSSNGTYIKGQRLPRGRSVDLPVGLAVLDLCSGVEIAVCSSEADEQTYFQQDINPDYSVPGSSAGEDEEFPPLGQSPEDIRAVLEKAAGLAGSLGHKFNAPNDKNVFEKLVHRQSNFAQDRREVASENGERIYAEEYGNSGHADASLRGRRGQQEAFTDFERYQRTRRQAPDNAQEFDADYELLAEAEFGEETLDSNQFSGTGKLLVFGLGLVLLVVIIVLSVSFLGGPYFISLD